MKKAAPKLSILFSMVIFGTIGLFRRWIPLSSGVLALSRGYIGSVFLMLFLLVRRKKTDLRAVKRNLLFLLLSGAMIGFNWILLFEAYRFTTVSVATLCYYMAPIFVMIFAPVFLKEKLTGKKALLILLALTGMVFVSGIMKGFPSENSLKGVILGLGAAFLYASVILLNKKIHDISAYDRTIVQLFTAATVLIPYVLLIEKPAEAAVTAGVILLVLFVGILHTGIAYALYFGAMEKLPAGTVALLSYIDPVAALILSAVFLKESMDFWTILGALFVLTAAILSEFVRDSE